jgi:hypothetical protein
MAKPLFPFVLLLSLPLATVCLKSQGTPPQSPAGAVQSSSTTAPETDDEPDADISDAVLAAVAERHDNQLALEKLKGELEAVIAVRDAANKSASEIAARITKLESEAANNEEQQIALVMEAFRQLLRSRLAESLDKEPGTELTLELAIQYRDFYTDMIAKLQSAKVPFASALSVELRGPDEMLAGETATYEIVVTNKGESELTGVRIECRADNSLLPRRASENYRVQSGSLVWNIGVLAPGEAAKPLTVVCDTVKPNSSAATQVLCSTDQGVTTSKGLNTVIRPSPTPSVTSAGTPRPGTGITTSQ